MKILLLCLHAFKMMEVSPFIDVFGWARDDFDCDIEVITCGFHKSVKSTFGVHMEVDVVIEDVDIQQYVALAIPGGFQEYGFYEEAYDERTLELIVHLISYINQLPLYVLRHFLLRKASS